MVVADQKSRRSTGMMVLMTLLLSVAAVVPARAVVVEDLYRATAVVADESEESLTEGYRVGLKQVLVRVSGDRDVAGKDGMEAHLENAEAMLQSSQVEPAGNGEDELRMAFSPREVNSVLATTGARVWGANRPLTLAWVAVQDGSDRGLLVKTGESSEQGWSALIQDWARERGLPLVLPPADKASDNSLLSDVWGHFMMQVSAASSDIEHDLLAVVRVSRRNGGWQASWQFQGRDIEQSQSVTADSQEALAGAMVDAWVGELASRYAVTGTAVETGPYVRLSVDGIGSPKDYADIKRALSQLNPVQSVSAISVSRDRIVFKVEHSGEVAQLQQNISLDNRFQTLSGKEQSSADSSGDEDFDKVAQTLFYRWQDTVIAPSGAATEQ